MTTFRKTLFLGGSFYLGVSNTWGQPLLLLCVGSPDPPSQGFCLHRATPEVLSIGDPGAGAHQGEKGHVCLGSAHLLQVSSKAAWHVQVHSGKSHIGLSVPSL